MLIDCETCAMRGGPACDDCVVAHLLGDGPVALSRAQADALANLADGGLIPRLRQAPLERRAG